MTKRKPPEPKAEPPYYTVGQLIKALSESGVPPETPVWAIGLHARLITSMSITTTADPFTGRPMGDPAGATVVVLK
jgi:hypothetical protein